jgi:hypothetical protein
MTSDDVRALLREDVARYASRAMWAQAHGVTRQYLHDVMKGHREPGPSILRALGLQRNEAVSYERSA